MKTMEFVVRPSVGASQRGMVEADASLSIIEVSPGAEISLNIRQFELASYVRSGTDLQITLADGRVVMLKDYFSDGAPVARLFISADGYLSEVALVEGANGVLYAQYGPTEIWSKWSAHDDLIFADGAALVEPAAEGDEVSMLGAGLLMGGGALGAAGGGVAALAAGSLLLGGGGDDGAPTGPVAGPAGAPGPGEQPVPVPGGGGEVPPPVLRMPTVNEKDLIQIGGGDTPAIIISGTGEPGANVDVTIGDKALSTPVDDSGKWQVVFEGDKFPADGSYPVVVDVTQPDGSEVDLTGPNVVIDTVPPALTFTEGTVSNGDLFNMDSHPNGVRIGGTSEPGAEISVVIGTATRTTQVDGDGNWSVNFTPAEVPGGEETRDLMVTATDSFGNSAIYRDSAAIDTVPDPITIAGMTGGDGVVNATEAAGVVSVQGTSTPGNALTLVLEGGGQTITRTVTVQADGSWQVDYQPDELRGGEYDVTLTATTSDAAGNIGRQTGGFRVDTVHFVQIDPAPLGEDNLINAAAVDDGVTLRGTTQPGSVVEVRFGSVTRQVTSTDGTWAIAFSGSDFARAEYDETFMVSARDAAGNTSTASRAVRVDTEIAVTLDGEIGDNGLINAVTRDQGVTLRGTTDSAQNTVTVQVGGAARAATVDQFGNWQVRFEAADLPQGQGDLTVVATATDAARNSASAQTQVQYDTEVRDFAYTETGVAADGIINGVEEEQGLFVTGQVEAGSRVLVTLDGVQREANVLPDGVWSVRYEPSQIRDGEYTTSLTAVATDRAGNSERISHDVRVDTRLNLLEITGPVTGDDIINLAESKAGFEVAGRVEHGPGEADRSSVQVEFDGRFYDATVDGAGNWRAFVPGEHIRTGVDNVDMIVRATDAAGNPGMTTQVLAIDTVDPVNPIVVRREEGPDSTFSVTIKTTDDGISFTEIRSDGTMVDVQTVPADIVTRGDTLHDFGSLVGGGFTAAPVPDGSNLIVMATDQAGNASGTFLALDNAASRAVDLSTVVDTGLRIDAIDLSFAEDRSLTLSEAQILALSPDDRSLTVHGGNDDSVTLSGASREGAEMVGGRSYAVYAMGDARVIVDEEIQIG